MVLPASLQCQSFREEAEGAVLPTPNTHTVAWRHAASIHVGYKQQRDAAISLPSKTEFPQFSAQNTHVWLYHSKA